MPVLSDRALDRIHTLSRRHPGTIRSHAGIRIHPHMIPPRTVRKSQPHRPTDFLIGHGLHVEPAPPGEDTGSKPGPEVVFISLKLPSTGEANGVFSGRHHPAQ